MTETIEPMTEAPIDQRFAQDLVDRARAEGVDLTGPGGLLTGLTKQVLETALETELAEHLGYDKHDPAGRNRANSRNGTRSKTATDPLISRAAFQHAGVKQLAPLGDLRGIQPLTAQIRTTLPIAARLLIRGQMLQLLTRGEGSPP
jgi:hypothetical protein